MATLAGCKAIKVIACWSHNLVDTEQAGLSKDQLHAIPVDETQNETLLEVFSGIRESLKVQRERPPKYWSPMLVFSGGSPESGLGSV